MKTAVIIKVSGRVQGVGFRFYTQRKAIEPMFLDLFKTSLMEAFTSKLKAKQQMYRLLLIGAEMALNGQV
jgi:hypothetical protein